jgi:DnaJ-class molecular chaperone
VERVPIAAGTVKGGVYVHRVKGKGMPKKRGGYGDLVIELSVGRK